MAQLVLGIGTSHTPMLNAPPTDWPRFYERDSKRTNLLDTEGRLTSYDAQLKHAPAGIAGEIAPERMQARHAAVQGAMARLGDYLREARLDTLIVVGDDQEELYHSQNMPGILVYYGETIRNVPLAPAGRPLARGKGAARLSGRCGAGAPPDRPADRRRVRHRRLGRGARGRRRGPRDRLCSQADHAGRRADRAGLHQHLLPAEPAGPAALLQARPGDPRRGRELSGRHQGR